ncbi:hypothetical protein Tsubulata_030686 [Turnera subulata]|uniref:Stress-related protein n=1 Tax=Turnera subulata TaxID=218843 RepID=A0A9Q0JNK3_9ROSI|nr:hypothetical protein Tsubulata_030686 [Turnera subulata]
MAESEPNQHTEIVENNEKQLKYLGFVQEAAMYVLESFATVYEYAKKNSGPLKPGVQNIEGAIKTVIGSIYENFHDVPFKILRFLDCKVGEYLSEMDRHVPSLVKQALTQARAGVVDAAKSISKTVYMRYEPVAEHYAVVAWHSLNQLPLLAQVVHISVPTVAHWVEKYNEMVGCAGQKGYTVTPYLPLVPVERIAKIFDEGVNGPSVSANGEAMMTRKCFE